MTVTRADNPAELAVLISRCLEDAGIPYAVGGAVAYGFWGVPRGTQDLDLNLFVPAEQAAGVRAPEKVGRALRRVARYGLALRLGGGLGGFRAVRSEDGAVAFLVWVGLISQGWEIK